jgi:hypothetical protein
VLKVFVVYACARTYHRLRLACISSGEGRQSQLPYRCPWSDSWTYRHDPTHAVVHPPLHTYTVCPPPPPPPTPPPPPPRLPTFAAHAISRLHVPIFHCHPCLVRLLFVCTSHVSSIVSNNHCTATLCDARSIVFTYGWWTAGLDILLFTYTHTGH